MDNERAVATKRSHSETWLWKGRSTRVFRVGNVSGGAAAAALELGTERNINPMNFSQPSDQESSARVAGGILIPLTLEDRCTLEGPGPEGCLDL